MVARNPAVDVARPVAAQYYSVKGARAKLPVTGPPRGSKPVAPFTFTRAAPAPTYRLTGSSAPCYTARGPADRFPSLLQEDS